MVEDDILIALELEELLRDLGAGIVGPFRTLERARASLQREAVDGAILDVRLDGDTTFDLAEGLENSGVPILFVTGCRLEDVSERFEDTPCLPKPFEPSEFQEFATSVFGDAR